MALEVATVSLELIHRRRAPFAPVAAPAGGANSTARSLARGSAGSRLHCGNRGCFEPSGALVLDQNLQVSARLHARDMAERNFFAHETPDGVTMLDRMQAAGFAGCTAGENIAQGQRSPEEVVESWISSPGHCANILSDNFTGLGVGYFDQEDLPQRHLWVQNFGG